MKNIKCPHIQIKNTNAWVLNSKLKLKDGTYYTPHMVERRFSTKSVGFIVTKIHRNLEISTWSIFLSQDHKDKHQLKSDITN